MSSLMIRKCYLEACEHTCGGEQSRKRSRRPLAAWIERAHRHRSLQDILQVMTGCRRPKWHEDSVIWMILQVLKHYLRSDARGVPWPWAYRAVTWVLAPDNAEPELPEQTVKTGYS